MEVDNDEILVFSHNMKDAIVLNYCMGAKPITTVINRYKELLQEIDFVDDQDLENESVHISEEEVKETLPLLSFNIRYLAEYKQNESIREQWKTTREDYCRIEDTKCIDYNHMVISAYAIGTTPIHTFMLRHLVSTHLSLEQTTHIVCLCGGSGAELLAFILSYKSVSKHIQFTIIDKEKLWSSTDENNYGRLQQLVKTADICTLIYGISELLDYDMDSTHRLLSVLCSSLPSSSYFLITDPLSHQFCCEKEHSILRLFSQYHWKLTYRGHDKVSVSRSLIEPHIQQYCTDLGLQINRDVKLSCHVWTMIFNKIEDEIGHFPKRICLGDDSSHLSHTLILTQSPCVQQWYLQLQEQVHTNVWLLRESDEVTNQAAFTRLVQSWRQFGGVALMSYSQWLNGFLLSSLLPTLVVFHNYDIYCETEKASLWHSLQNLIQSSSSSSIVFIASQWNTAIEKRVTDDLFDRSIVVESIVCEAIAKENEANGVFCEVEECTWTLTEDQSDLCLLCDGNNNLRTLFSIHPALLFQVKYVNPKHIDKQIYQELTKRYPIKSFDPHASERTRRVIDLICQCKQQEKSIVILCRLQPSVSVLQACIEVSNNSAEKPITVSVVNSFKKTQAKTSYRLSRASFASDVVIMHISCIPLLHIRDEVDVLVFFESSLGGDKARETIRECIDSFFFQNRQKSMKVIKF